VSKAESTTLAGKGILYGLKAVVSKAPVPRPTKLILVGLNYRDHAEEAGMKIPTEPTLFSKYPSVVIGSGEGICMPSRCVRESDRCMTRPAAGVASLTAVDSLPAVSIHDSQTRLRPDCLEARR
jgi:hypothetical protein